MGFDYLESCISGETIIDLAQIELEMFARSSREKILERALLPIEDDFDEDIIDETDEISEDEEEHEETDEEADEEIGEDEKDNGIQDDLEDKE